MRDRPASGGTRRAVTNPRKVNMSIDQNEQNDMDVQILDLRGVRGVVLFAEGQEPGQMTADVRGMGLSRSQMAYSLTRLAASALLDQWDSTDGQELIGRAAFAVDKALADNPLNGSEIVMLILHQLASEHSFVKEGEDV
jgi:hypothetical protein